MPEQMSTFLGSQNHLYPPGTLFWDTCIAVSQKPEFSDFTVSGSGLPMGYRHWKYVSLCWSNSDIMATAPRGCVLLLHHKFASSKEKQMTKCI